MTAKTRSILCVIVIALALPATAVAGNGRNGLPSGNSGAYQYVESIPTAHGSKPDSTVGTGSHPAPSSVPASTQRSLLSQGRAGRAAYSVAAATAPKIKRRPRTHRRPVAAASGTSTPPGSSGGIASPGGTGRGTAVLQALIGVGNGSGAGLLPIILIVIAGGAVAVRLRRRSAADSQ
jgi:hypothetical protein